MEEKNFHPSSTHSSPLSRRARVVNCWGSDPPGARSSSRQEKTSPARRGCEVPGLLFLGAVVGDDLGVAGVGGLGPEDDRRPARDPRGSRSAAPASAGRSPCPPASGPRWAAQRPARRTSSFMGSTMGSELVVERVELAVGVRVRSRGSTFSVTKRTPGTSSSFSLELGLGGEVPGHRRRLPRLPARGALPSLCGLRPNLPTLGPWSRRGTGRQRPPGWPGWWTRTASATGWTSAGPAGQGRARHLALHQRRGLQRDLRHPPRRFRGGAPPAPTGGPRGAQQDHAARVPGPPRP